VLDAGEREFQEDELERFAKDERLNNSNSKQRALNNNNNNNNNNNFVKKVFRSTNKKKNMFPSQILSSEMSSIKLSQLKCAFII